MVYAARRSGEHQVNQERRKAKRSQRATHYGGSMRRHAHRKVYSSRWLDQESRGKAERRKGEDHFPGVGGRTEGQTNPARAPKREREDTKPQHPER